MVGDGVFFQVLPFCHSVPFFFCPGVFFPTLGGSGCRGRFFRVFPPPRRFFGVKCLSRNSPFFIPSYLLAPSVFYSPCLFP